MDAVKESYSQEDESWSTVEEIDSDTDDSEEDPAYEPLEAARSRLSKISLKASSPRETESEIEVEEESLSDETENALFDRVEKKIKDANVDTLKVEECKAYLRRYSLRLSGKKSDLIARIKEHQNVLGGGGLSKYPVSSFSINCKGDACTGDVVMFQQEGKNMSRTVVGRIVKESYGDEKQQHTFTIEVLWSKGKKALPSLYPLLIKGRNLYKLKTMRQVWPDEAERRKFLDEKHRRGDAARCRRDARIREKEMRATMRGRSWFSLLLADFISYLVSFIMRHLYSPPTKDVRDKAHEKRGTIPPVNAAAALPRTPRVPDLPDRRSNVQGITRIPLQQMEINRHPTHHARPDYSHRTSLSTIYAPPPPSSSSSSSSSSFDHGAWMNAQGALAARHAFPTTARVPERRAICVFHLQRRCRYGEWCPNIHMERDKWSMHPRYR